MTSPPPCRPPGSVGLLVSEVGRSVARSLHACLEPLGLDPRQWLVLRTVGTFPHRSQQAVGASLQIPPSRMVALVDGLAGRGLLERVANPVDRRAHALCLTAEGRRLVERAEPVATTHEQEVCHSLDDAERAVLLNLLARIARDRGLAVTAPAGPPVGGGDHREP